VRSHDQVNGAGRERVHQPLRTGRHAQDGRVLDEHRDHDIAFLAEIRDARGHASATGGQRRRLRGKRVENGQGVSS
jgi:hypothetical protein